MKIGLAPIADKNARLLILGSLPGDESIRQQQYYAHPRNHFWHIMAALLETELPDDYESRREILLRRGIALWDVLRSAERDGSLDTSIRSEQPNDLRAFLSGQPKISFILLNGSKAAASFARHFGELELPHAAVRSSSPVPSRRGNTADEKIILWRRALDAAGIKL